MGTSSCGGRVEAREGKGKAQLRRPAASRPRRNYSGPPPPSARKLKSRWAGCRRCPIIGASREKHPPPSPREGKADFFGFDSIARNHAEKGNQLGFHLRIRSPPYPRGRPETEPKRHASVAIRQGAGNCPAPIMFSASMLSSVSAFPCVGTISRIDAFPRTGASSHIGTSPAPPSGYTPMVPIRSSSDAVSIHQTPELSCVNVSSTWRSAASASRVTSRKIWPPCL